MELARRLSDGLVQCLSSFPKSFAYETVQEDIVDDEEQQDKRGRSDSVDSGFIDSSDIALDCDEDEGLNIIEFDDLMLHNTREDGWIVVFNKVYDISNYIDKNHPGGEEVLLEYVGYDATMAFRSVGHSKGALKLLEKYCIGILPKNERINFE